LINVVHGSLFAQRYNQAVNEQRQIALFAPALSEKRDYLENSAQPSLQFFHQVIVDIEQSAASVAFVTFHFEIHGRRTLCGNAKAGTAVQNPTLLGDN
jgi:hypothetical protein